MERVITAKSIYGDTVVIAGKMKVTQKNGKESWKFVLTESRQGNEPGNWSGKIEAHGFALVSLSHISGYQSILKKAVEITDDDLGGAPSPITIKQ